MKMFVINGTRHNKHKNNNHGRKGKNIIPKVPSGQIEFDKWKCFGYISQFLYDQNLHKLSTPYENIRLQDYKMCLLC